MPMGNREHRRYLRAHEALRRELGALLSPELAEAWLEEEATRVRAEEAKDPGVRLRGALGSRLLDAVADLLERVAEETEREEG